MRTPTVQHGFDPQQSTSSSDIYKTSSLPGTLLSPPSRQSCSWMDRHGRPASPPYQYGGHRTEHRDRYDYLYLTFEYYCFICVNTFRVRRVELIIEPGQSLGLMIRGGIEYGLGIFVTGVDEGSVAEREELRVKFYSLKLIKLNLKSKCFCRLVIKFLK